MPLVNLKNMLNTARKEKYAIGAFDVSNYEMASAVLETAEETHSPVILMGLTADLKGMRLKNWIDGIRKIAECASVPVCVHLDHATDFEMIKRCVDAGFTSVMYDGSLLPIETNIMRTKEVVDYAHQFDVTVEAELGHVGDGIVGNSETGPKQKAGYDNPDDFLTKPEEMKYFISNTSVDCLAVAVGTAHGIYVHEPKIHFDRLEKLDTISTVPLVMHGGSGTPDALIRASVERGICKLNIFSEMLTAFYTKLRDELNQAEHMAIWPCKANEGPLKALQSVVRAKLELVGSTGKAK